MKNLIDKMLSIEKLSVIEEALYSTFSLMKFHKDYRFTARQLMACAVGEKHKEIFNPDEHARGSLEYKITDNIIVEGKFTGIDGYEAIYSMK